MVKVMYNDKLVYEVVIWVIFGIKLWKEKVALGKLTPDVDAIHLDEEIHTPV